MSSSHNQMSPYLLVSPLSLCLVRFFSHPRHISVFLSLHPRPAGPALRRRRPLPPHGSGAAEPPRPPAGTPLLPRRIGPCVHELHGVLPQVGGLGGGDEGG